MIKFNPVAEDDPNIDLEYPPTMQPLIIKSKNDKLLGTFFTASGKEKHTLVLVLHGFPGNENNFDIAHAIKKSGFNVVVFHYRGSWGSSGDFSISNSLTDVSSIIDYFCKPDISNQFKVDCEKIILLGHNMVGFLSLLASLKYPKIKNVVSIAGKDDMVAHFELHRYPLVEALKSGEIVFASSIYKTGHSFASTRIRLSAEIIEWLKSVKL